MKRLVRRPCVSGAGLRRPSWISTGTPSSSGSSRGTGNATHFGGPPVDYETFEYAGTAAHALRQLDDAYAAWIAGVRGLDAEALARPCGPAEGPFAEYPMATLVLHINREVIHHGAEISLLRDLYLHQK
jgi:hypothetical protein